MYVKVEFYSNKLKRRYWPLVFTLHKTFKKNKTKSGTSLPASLFLEILGNMCIVIIVWDFINFRINLNLFIKPLSYLAKIQENNVNISRTKRTFNMKKSFLISFKRLSVVRICLRSKRGPLILFRFYLKVQSLLSPTWLFKDDFEIEKKKVWKCETVEILILGLATLP